MFIVFGFSFIVYVIYKLSKYIGPKANITLYFVIYIYDNEANKTEMLSQNYRCANDPVCQICVVVVLVGQTWKLIFPLLFFLSFFEGTVA